MNQKQDLENKIEKNIRKLKSLTNKDLTEEELSKEITKINLAKNYTEYNLLYQEQLNNLASSYKHLTYLRQIHGVCTHLIKENNCEQELNKYFTKLLFNI